MDTILSWIHQGYSTIVPFILLLGFLIFVHEMGHFLVAKWCGVRVETFSMGFGRKLIKFKRGDTTYALSLVPLGGYVKMFGDEIGAPIPEDQKRYAFTHKKLWQRIAVVLAGPVMNFLFAIVIFTVISIIGEDVKRPILGDVASDSPAYTMGFRSGDEIKKVDGEVMVSWDTLQEKLNHGVQKTLPFEVQRTAESSFVIQAKPEMKPNTNPLSLEDYVGEIDGFSGQSRAAVIGIVAKSQADVLGLKTGDRILSVNGKEVLYLRELENILVTMQGQEVNFEVERFEGAMNLDDRVGRKIKIAGKLNQVPSLASLGIEPGDLYLAKILEKSPAALAGLKEGDRIVKIGTVQPTKWEDILNFVKGYNGEGEVALTITRDSQEMNFKLTPTMTSHMNAQGAEEKRFTVGIMPWIQNAPSPIATLHADGIFSAVGRGYKRTKDVTVMTAVSFLRLLQAKISPKNIGGVISIGQAASETFKIGIGHFLQLMAVISVNLFILNLLPIPVLDGGHLLFYFIEAIRGGNPLSMRKMEIAQQIGLVLLMSLMALSLFNDFSRVFGLW